MHGPSVSSPARINGEISAAPGMPRSSSGVGGENGGFSEPPKRWARTARVTRPTAIVAAEDERARGKRGDPDGGQDDRE